VKRDDTVNAILEKETMIAELRAIDGEQRAQERTENAAWA
jgi:hypothetical protein